jgi:hypothetical protein
VAPIIDPTEPDSHLEWPRDIFVAELNRQLSLWERGVHRSTAPAAIGRLLRSAFQGPQVADEFDACGDNAHGTRLSTTQLAWLKQVAAEAAALPPLPPARPYWSQRSGMKREKLTSEVVMDRFVSLVASLAAEDWLWAEAFGVDCPDGIGDPVDTPTSQIEQRLGKAIGAGAWPLAESRKYWTVHDLFDLIEVLHDLASWPGSWDSHGYGGCPGHPGDFSPACGKALYRHRVNALLHQSTLGVRIADTGEDRGRIVHSAAPGLETLMDTALADAPFDFEDDVAHAVMSFRSRARDTASIRSAVVTLAGVLERHRDLLKRELLSKDETALFEIANTFDVRHRKANQRTDYDPAFLDWLFYWYLATVNLVAHLQRRERGDKSQIPPGDAVSSMN